MFLASDATVSFHLLLLIYYFIINLNINFYINIFMSYIVLRICSSRVKISVHPGYILAVDKDN